MTNSSSIRNFKLFIPFIIIGTISIVYYALYIYQSSYVINGERYFSLFDDAMVSMRYAKNFAQGYGLVWNPGETPVEGYTNPLWTIFYSLFHFFDIAPSKISLFIQIFCAIFLLLNQFFCYKIALLVSDNSKKIAVISQIFIAFYLPLNLWSLLGTEVAGISLLVSISIYILLKNHYKGEISSWIIFLLCLLTFIRMDSLIFCISVAISIYYIFPNSKKFILKLTIAIIFCLLAQSIARFLYYNEILPNTYYLKMTGYPIIYRITQGIYSILKFIAFFNPIIFLIPFLYVYFTKNKKLIFLLLPLVFQILYNIYVGGDAWDWWGGANRYLSITIAPFLILLVQSLTYFYDKLIDSLKNTFNEKQNFILNTSHKISLTPTIYAFLIFWVFITLNSLEGLASLSELLLIKKHFSWQDNITNTELAIEIEKITEKNDRVAVVTAGVLPYFLNRKCIDMLGKNDKYIARLPARQIEGKSKFLSFYPGHLKWDYNYSIGVLKPEIVVQLWKNPEEADSLLHFHYETINLGKYTIYKRKDTPNFAEINPTRNF